MHNEASAWPLIFDYNHKGNSVAGVIKPGRLETMFHAQFSDNRIAKIWRTLKHDARLKFLSDWRLTYQGRPVPENFV